MARSEPTQVSGGQVVPQRAVRPKDARPAAPLHAHAPERLERRDAALYAHTARGRCSLRHDPQNEMLRAAPHR